MSGPLEAASNVGKVVKLQTARWSKDTELTSVPVEECSLGVET
jgi:hypothetical protein